MTLILDQLLKDSKDKLISKHLYQDRVPMLKLLIAKLAKKLIERIILARSDLGIA